jgi:hypothetical protein
LSLGDTHTLDEERSMKSKVIAVLAIVGLLAFTQTLSAQEKKKERGPGGRIKSVDASAGTITVTMGRKGESTDKTYKVAKDCKVTIGDEAKTLADLKDGMFVGLTVKDDVVTEIRVRMRKKKDNA